MKAVLIALTKNRFSHRLEGFILAIPPKVETVTDFILLGSKVTVDSDGSHEMKRCLLLGRKAKANLACMHAGSSASSAVVAHRLSCSTARGIFPDQGWNGGSPPWEVLQP